MWHGQWHGVNQLTNGNRFISSNDYNSGLLFYDVETETISQIYTTGRSWSNVKELSNGDALIHAEYTEGILLYDASVGSVSSLSTKGYKWHYMTELSNGNVIISSQDVSYTYSIGLYLYDSENQTFSKLYNFGGRYNSVVETEGDYIVEISNGSKTLYYNIYTDGISETKADVELTDEELGDYIGTGDSGTTDKGDSNIETGELERP